MDFRIIMNLPTHVFSRIKSHELTSSVV